MAQKPTILRNGSVVYDRRLDLIIPADKEHVEKYPLRTLIRTDEAPVCVPGIVGFPWFENFDNPVRDSRGHWWIGRDKNNLGNIRGYHCFCLKPPTMEDADSWWIFYNQGEEGACVDFGISRCMSLLNRKRYDAPSHWLYWEAQMIDPWEGGSYPGASPFYEGTEVRAGLEVVRTKGIKPYRKGKNIDPSPQDGIAAYRWAQNTDEILRTLGMGDRDFVYGLNSWGRGFPRIFKIPAETVEVCMTQWEGECAFVTDR